MGEKVISKMSPKMKMLQVVKLYVPETNVDFIVRQWDRAIAQAKIDAYEYCYRLTQKDIKFLIEKIKKELKGGQNGKKD